MRIVLLVLISIALLALAVVGFGPRVYPPIAGWLLVASGYAPDCSRTAAAKGLYRRHLYDAAEKAAIQSSRRIQTDGRLMLTESSHGRFWEPAAEKSAVVAQVAELDSKYAAGAERAVRNGDVVLDCGANVGLFTAYALRSGARKVVAIEPDPIHVECLRRNFKNEIASRTVTIYPKGVWDREGTLILRESLETSAKNSFLDRDHSRPGLILPITTIDSIVAELHLERVDFIKMDIEGSEPRALAGARSTLTKWKPRMELEVSSGNQNTLAGIVRNSSQDYRVECLVCVIDTAAKRIVPSLISIR